MSDIMTVGEVAEYLKTSPETVRGLIAGGELRAFRLGERGRWRVKRDDLDTFVEFRKSLQADPWARGLRGGGAPFYQTARSAARNGTPARKWPRA